MTRFTLDPKEMHYSGSPLYVVPREDPEGEWVRFSVAAELTAELTGLYERYLDSDVESLRLENARLSAALQASQIEVARLSEEKFTLGQSIDRLLKELGEADADRIPLSALIGEDEHQFNDFDICVRCGQQKPKRCEGHWATNEDDY